MRRGIAFPAVIIFAAGTIVFCLIRIFNKPSLSEKTFKSSYVDGGVWVAPGDKEIPVSVEGERIRFGRELIVHTARYLGPHGTLKKVSNSMNCQNCHTYAGTQNFGNPFSAVASTYPKYRDRSGKIESVEFRVNDCLQRSMNGTTLDSQSAEMRAMVAYIKWVGKDVPKNVRPKGVGVGVLPLLNRAANMEEGKRIYVIHCQNCHGKDGQGLRANDSSEYVYPPLWGEQSFNVGAGIYRLSMLAGFVKNNMPYGIDWKSPKLTDEEAWDVAAFVVSQPRPVRSFPNDWKNLSKKPFDFPFGPYNDRFSEKQHKFGPFKPMKSKS